METPSDATAAAAPLKELNQSPPPPPVNSQTPPPDFQNQSKIQTPQISITCPTESHTITYKCKASGTPDRLKLPKSFKYPERYTSPTDHIISPISKGLARSRRGALLPPSIIHSKINELRAPEDRAGSITSKLSSA